MREIKSYEWRDVKTPCIKWKRGIFGSQLTYFPSGNQKGITLRSIEYKQNICNRNNKQTRTFVLTDSDIMYMILPRII